MQPTTEVRHWYGFILSLITAVMWGVLPVFLKLVLHQLDAITITWYRFAAAFLIVMLMLVRVGALPSMRALSRNNNLILLVAALGLVVNYVFYLMGLDYLNPETGQVVIQLAPFLLMVGGVYFYKEHFNTLEWVGAVMLFIGLMVFFNNRLDELFLSMNDYSFGVILIIIAAIAWAIYGLLQKKLMRTMTAKQVTLIMYLAGVITLLPFSNLPAVINLELLQVGALIFCCLNTVIGYGAFTEAMYVWHASKVSAVIALAPLITILSMYVAIDVWPQYFAPSDLNWLAYIGAGLVVCGSMVVSIGKGKAQTNS
ncbi:DMT family transporter [Alteromonadaceae bacterium BrNp21-10]|nr:DMT family transporter [Alteromonadaceae bacterium BrNp21-10]